MRTKKGGRVAQSGVSMLTRRQQIQADNQSLVRPGRISPTQPVPVDIQMPDYAMDGKPKKRKEDLVKSPELVKSMRKAGKLAAETLEYSASLIEPGITTDEIDRKTHEFVVARGAYPSPLNYNGYPKSICTSVNEVICHGIPDDRELLEGDIVNIDVTVFIDGVHGDTDATYPVGKIDDDSAKLIRVTRECMEHGIDQVKPGAPINSIGKAIETHARANKMGVVRAFVGHGIGEVFHNTLHVPHYYDPGMRVIMEPGMTFTIEPMITLGSWRHVMWDDNWTATTVDMSRTAQFEHTILVTDSGHEVLTLS